MPELKTSDALLSALKRAAESSPTGEELESQRVSFIMGSLKETSGITRDRVREVLAQQGGKQAL